MTAAPKRLVSREEIEAELRRWASGATSAADLKAWAEASATTDPAAREVLAELDVLEVFLLLPEDVPALLALLHEGDAKRGLEAWTRYRDAIDLDARSKRLKKDKLYRPFCR